ncbi:hypothetical protein [Macrococcus equipercicus]|uniref:Uncharacterized protein n=1 Tax=Macrococcus equipercicus TaxID=69967 RepID=A0A9Q9BMX2_9STAP|nr:hypothetical protein [Macrococcus equipercicus]UTH13455.1 hypothetical protein KFV11_09510 [Macrococcus equipercicus]
MKSLLKGLFFIVFLLAIIITGGAAVLFTRFKADFEDIERRTQDIIAKIESENV